MMRIEYGLIANDISGVQILVAELSDTSKNIR